MSDLRRKKQEMRVQELVEANTPSVVFGEDTLLTIVRALVGPGFVIGGWELIPQSFVWGVVIVYAGFVLCFIECIREPKLLKRSDNLQLALILILIVFVAMFTIGVVIVRAPLRFSTLVSDIDYSSTPSATPGGIKWQPFFSELDLAITNPTDKNYTDIDVLIRPDRPIAAIAQVSTLPGFSYEDRFGMNARITVADENAKKLLMSMVLLATDAGYKVHCGLIPPQQSLRIIMAIVGVRKTTIQSLSPGLIPIPPGLPSGVPINTLFSQHLSTEVTFSDKEGEFHYWLGGSDNPSLFESSPSYPQHIAVNGYYTADYKRRKVNEVVAIKGWPDSGK